MRFLRIFAFFMFLLPFASNGATNEFMVAAQLLSAAKNADIQTSANFNNMKPEFDAQVRNKIIEWLNRL